MLTELAWITVVISSALIMFSMFDADLLRHTRMVEAQCDCSRGIHELILCVQNFHDMVERNIAPDRQVPA